MTATDALRQLHQRYVDTLLGWRDIPHEFSLLAPPDCSIETSPAESATPRSSITPPQTAVSSDDRPSPDSGTAGNGEELPHGDAAGSNSSDASTAGSSLAQGDEASPELSSTPLSERAGEDSAGGCREKGAAARGSFLDEGGRSECGSEAERDKPSFSMKPAIHSYLCCNIPAKVCVVFCGLTLGSLLRCDICVS